MAGGALGAVTRPERVRSLFRATNVLRVANQGDPTTLDPSGALHQPEWTVVRNVYDGLVDWNPGNRQLVPGLATSWHHNADATVWTFNLRRGVRFHDGAPFNSTRRAEDDRVLQEERLGLIWANVATIDDSDPYVLKVKFSAPSPDLLRNQTIARMLSPKAIAANTVGNHPVGTGAYRFVNGTTEPR